MFELKYLAKSSLIEKKNFQALKVGDLVNHFRKSYFIHLTFNSTDSFNEVRSYESAMNLVFLIIIFFNLSYLHKQQVKKVFSNITIIINYS